MLVSFLLFMCNTALLTLVKTIKVQQKGSIDDRWIINEVKDKHMLLDSTTFITF